MTQLLCVGNNTIQCARRLFLPSAVGKLRSLATTAIREGNEVDKHARRSDVPLPWLHRINPSWITISTTYLLEERRETAVEQNIDDIPPHRSPSASSPSESSGSADQPSVRLPRSVQAIYLRPLRRHATYGVPSCDLQLRSYNARNVEFFADFAIRAAYYLNLPACGPVPLPRIIERWTVPRSNFIFKKSQENFERITLRRLIQVQDGHPETVNIWLAFLRKHAYYGVGMKANIWEYENLGKYACVTRCLEMLITS